ncbi:hypothetical protein ABG067_008444, partial [Albugo candida]
MQQPTQRPVLFQPRVPPKSYLQPLPANTPLQVSPPKQFCFSVKPLGDISKFGDCGPFILPAVVQTLKNNIQLYLDQRIEGKETLVHVSNTKALKDGVQSFKQVKIKDYDEDGLEGIVKITRETSVC